MEMEGSVHDSVEKGDFNLFTNVTLNTVLLKGEMGCRGGVKKKFHQMLLFPHPSAPYVQPPI
jgi:hypothetical protein